MATRVYRDKQKKLLCLTLYRYGHRNHSSFEEPAETLLMQELVKDGRAILKTSLAGETVGSSAQRHILSLFLRYLMVPFLYYHIHTLAGLETLA